MIGFKKKLNAAIAALSAGSVVLVLAGIGLSGAASAQGRQSNDARQPNVAQAQKPAAPTPAPRPPAVPQPVPEVFEKWVLRCFQDAKGNQACRIETLVREPNNRPQLAVVVRPPSAENQPPVATVTPPWGIILARGLDMQVDTQAALRIPIRTCLPTGCLADFSLIDAILGQWQKGTTLKLTMAAANGQSLTIEVPMAGFPKAYAKLMEKSKR